MAPRFSDGILNARRSSASRSHMPVRAKLRTHSSLFLRTAFGCVLGLLALAQSAARGAPANDHFADAIVLTGNSVSVTGSNVGATKESGEPNHADNPGGRSVWWKWTAAENGYLT